jgi:hypothetical protein
MRPHILMLALVAVLACASAAAAKDPPRPPKPRAAAPCYGRVALILRGTFVSGGSVSFHMIVRSGYGPARRLLGPRALQVNAQTQFRRNGVRSTLAALRPNDQLLVYARGCKRSKTAKRLELLARNVFAHGRRAP